MKENTRPVPAWWRKSVVYQINLRTFTPQGTLKSAEEKLEHVAKTGADFVYLCPVVLSDNDMNEDNWSKRQKASGSGNPQNSYRISDYFEIDPEYGNAADLDSFVKKAHSLGLKVMLDLVYMHCGPKAKMLEEHPDFVKRNEDGSLALNSYCFATINFNNPELCKYLQDNMVYFVEKFDIDGYRLDVGDKCPLDFWCEGARRVREIKPEFIFLNEGRLPEFVRDFCDANYGLDWTYYAIRDVFNGKFDATMVKEQWQKDFDLLPEGALQCRAYENHDVSNDAYENRMEKVNGAACGELALVINFAIDGVPFIYNGNEIADCVRHSFFANRFYGGYIGIDWSRAEDDTAKRRMAVISQLVSLKRSEKALYEGVVEWNETENSDKIVSFSRVAGDEKVTLYANVSKESTECAIEIGKTIMASGATIDGKKLCLAPYGYAIIKK